YAVPCRRCRAGWGDLRRSCGSSWGDRAEALDERLVAGKRVTHPVALRVEVALVELAHPDHERHELLDLDAALGQLPRLLGVVAQQAHAADAEVLEDPDSGPVVACVGGQAEREVGVERVEAVLLQAVGTQLVDEADATPLLTAQVDDHAALGLDRVESGLQLRAA